MILLREREREIRERRAHAFQEKRAFQGAKSFVPNTDDKSSLALAFGFGKKEVAHDLGKRAVSRWWRQNQTRVN